MSSSTTTNNEKKSGHQASLPNGVGQPPRKKFRSTADLENPTLQNFELLLEEGPFPEDSLSAVGSLFGVDRSWFVRESYIRLFDDILNDTARRVQIINGTAGIGKSSFLMYVLARMRSRKKSVLLHYHRNTSEIAVTAFFPADGSDPEQITRNDKDYLKTFKKWYATIDEEKSIFLVDGIVSFSMMDYPNVKYVAAKTPSCDIGWMAKSQNRRDRWLQVWKKAEMLSYATQAGIPNAEEVIQENMLHLGGVSRYAFKPGAAENAANAAVAEAGAKELFKLVTTGLTAKFENQKIVDRLVHRHPPESGIGVSGTSFTFATEYVSKKVAMALALENEIETKLLLDKFKTVGPAGGMRGVLFEAYAARKIAEGGEFQVKQLGTGTEDTLQLQKTSILQKDTKRLFKTTYPPSEIKDRLVWPNPDINMPAIDMFMLYQTTVIAHQMTVSKAHTLDIGGARAFLRYFDSVCAELFPSNATPTQYNLYFVVPADIYDHFSKSIQSITGPNGTLIKAQEATDISARISQWVMKVE
jgi:hypothetical protein